MQLTLIGKDPASNPTGSLPGNDFYLFDDRLAVFLLYAGNGLSVGKVSSSNPSDLRLCRAAFEAVWKLAIPHREYSAL